MCIEDVWIARHCKYRYAGKPSPGFTLPGNPRRFGLLYTRGFSFSFTSVDGRQIVDYNGQTSPGGLIGTITTAVPPGVDTISATAGGAAYTLQPVYFTIFTVGPLIMSAGTVGGTDTLGDVWEIEGDEVFEQTYSRFDASKK